MEIIFNNIINGGLTPILIFNLFVSILIIMISLWIRGWIIRYLAFIKFKGSLDISKDVIVRESTSIGHIDFILDDVDQSSIVLRSIDNKLKKIIPTKIANDRDWIIVQRKDV